MKTVLALGCLSVALVISVACGDDDGCDAADGICSEEECDAADCSWHEEACICTT